MMSSDEFVVSEDIHNLYGRKDRYTYAKIVRNNKVMFLKTGTGEDSTENLRRELIWADFMSYVAKRFPELKARAPQESELLSDNQLIMEYLDLPLLASPRNPEGWTRQIDR
jgi:hypothetical protein